MFVEVFKELSVLLNFSYTVTTPPDGNYGALKDNGTWNGMVGQLAKKAVHFGRHTLISKFNESFFNFDHYSRSFQTVNETGASVQSNLIENYRI